MGIDSSTHLFYGWVFSVGEQRHLVIGEICTCGDDKPRRRRVVVISPSSMTRYRGWKLNPLADFVVVPSRQIVKQTIDNLQVFLVAGGRRGRRHASASTPAPAPGGVCVGRRPGGRVSALREFKGSRHQATKTSGGDHIPGEKFRAPNTRVTKYSISRNKHFRGYMMSGREMWRSAWLLAKGWLPRTPGSCHDRQPEIDCFPARKTKKRASVAENPGTILFNYIYLNKIIQIFIKLSWTFIETRRFGRNSPFIIRNFFKKFEKREKNCFR